MATNNFANKFIEQSLTKYLTEIEAAHDADALTYVGDLMYGADDQIREAIEEIPTKRNKLIFILETPGGYAEVARRISDTTRHHYAEVDFLVPSHAMSAGTILVMSGDSILMDYYSVLGPIDPQIETRETHRSVSALGYLKQYEKLMDKANQGTLNTAEMNILMSFDQGDLFDFEQAKTLSKKLLAEWLCKYKFKNWQTTQTRGLPVTDAMREARAHEIAEKLNAVEHWNSHGLGINMERVKNELNLTVDDFSLNQTLNDAVRSYHRLLIDYLIKMGYSGAVNTRMSFEGLRV